ncbi:MAG: zinc-ribbon domain [Actinomycetota bacterium]|jgi:DNA-directed RNA polymerase subunit RPC12/RpoP
MNYCSDCGKPIVKDAFFCANCGKKLISDDSTQNHESPEQKNSSNVATYSWVGVGIALIIGIPAIQSAIGMPSQAEYVTFDFSINHLLNGGWYTWYSGDSAITAKFLSGGGMDASNFRLILWVVSGFAFSFAAPQIKAWFRR